MDIISHTLSGVAVGTVAAAAFQGLWKTKCIILLSGGLGGMLPDIDAVSLWSKFDATIGAALALEHSGREIYFGKFWYSHHAAFHSLLMPFLVLLLSIGFNAVFINKLNRNKIRTSVFKNKHAYFAFLFGFVVHLLEDMPTPASVWGGVNLFFPNSNYVGGFGKIWWWNNYDLVLLISAVIIVNLLIILMPKIPQKLKMYGSCVVFALGVFLFLVQINSRPTNFNYAGHTANYYELEAASKRIQKEILGERVFTFMTKVDQKIPLNF